MQAVSNNKQDKGKPLVSFIIPYYNIPIEWLRECIDSILYLSLNICEREIIIVDDGSSINAKDEFSDYSESIKYIRQENGGLSCARNTGIGVACGQYIQFVDSDDRLNPQQYDKCIDIIRQETPDILLFDFSHTPIYNHEYSVSKCTSGAEYMANNNIHATAWGYIFKKELLQDNLRFTPGIYHEDEEFTPQLLVRSKTIVSTDIKAYMYRQRSDSITSSRDMAKIIKRLDDKRDVIIHLNNIGGTLSDTAKQAMERRTAQLTMDYIYNIILSTRSYRELKIRLEDMREAGLFPLPERSYTKKYKWFRKISGCHIGRRMMAIILPLIQKER